MYAIYCTIITWLNLTTVHCNYLFIAAESFNYFLLDKHIKRFWYFFYDSKKMHLSQGTEKMYEIIACSKYPILFYKNRLTVNICILNPFSRWLIVEKQNIHFSILEHNLHFPLMNLEDFCEETFDPDRWPLSLCSLTDYGCHIWNSS